MALREDLVQKDIWRLFEIPWDSRELPLEEFLKRILDRWAEWFGAQSVSLFLEDGTGYALTATGGAGPKAPTNARIVPGEGIAGVSIERGEPLLVNDPRDHPALRDRVDKLEAHASSIIVPLKDDHGGCLGVLNMSRSIGKHAFSHEELRRVGALARHLALAVANARLFTSLQAANEETTAAKATLDAVLSHLQIAVIHVDDSGRILSANPKARSVFGTDRGELEELAASVSPHLASSIRSSLQEQADSRKHVLDNDADRAWSLICTSLPIGGRVVSIEETTEHEQARRELARMARLAEIGQMTAAIAHEIRNPLTGISSAAQIILEIPDQAEEFARIIGEEVVKLNQLCEEFLEFARPLALRLSPLSLSELSQSVADRLKPEFDAAKVRLTVEIDRIVPTIEADALRLEQVLWNLLLNALQATKAGGTVTLSVSEDGFAVEDTGEGMSPEQVGRLFTPFFTTKPRGTGLGLSNVRKIVDAHQGRITVSSELGKGARFTVSLPRRTA